MTSIKTPNTSIQSKGIEETNSFFVSDSIKHLVSEQMLVSNDDHDNSLFATSCIIAKVSAKDMCKYCDVISYSPNSLLKIESGSQIFKLFHENQNFKIKLLLKNEKLEIDLNCKFLQFDEIRNGSYIYSLKILDN